MAGRLARMRDRVRQALGHVDPQLADVLRVLEHEATMFLPMVRPEREQVCRQVLRALEAGWKRGDGRAGLRRALRAGVEFDERPPAVADEMLRLHAAVAQELELLPDRFD